MDNSGVCVDVDAKRVADLQRGISPIHEQGLEPLLQRNAAAGRLVFTDDITAAVAHGTAIESIAINPIRPWLGGQFSPCSLHARCHTLCHTRSMISAMPWPTPMHMVHSA